MLLTQAQARNTDFEIPAQTDILFIYLFILEEEPKNANLSLLHIYTSNMDTHFLIFKILMRSISSK